WRGGGNSVAELNGAWRAGRCHLHHPPVRAGKIRVQPPPQALIEALGAIDVGDREDNDLEFQFDRCSASDISYVPIGRLRTAHCDLLDPSAFAASSPRPSPSTRLKAGNGWMTSASVFNGVASLIASTSSPRISPARGVTRVAPISTPRVRSPTSFSTPLWKSWM